MLLFIVAGLCAGLLSGLLGIGGGIVLVPLLTIFAGMEQHKAQGTSLAVLLLPVGILAVLSYRARGQMDGVAALYIAAGFVAGALAGGMLAGSMPEPVLRKAFAVLMIITAVYMFIKR